MKKSPKKIDLSVIILNYNSHDYLAKCLQSIYNSDLDQSTIDIIVPDNGSVDNSLELGKKVAKTNTRFFKIGSNTGFSAGNNYGLKYVSPQTKYVLFLNVDTYVYPDTLGQMVKFFDSDSKVDAATCYVNKVVNNTLQPECHRGFPTPWNAFCHFFLPFLPKLFPKSKLFNGYFLGHLDYSKIQRIDCCVGAFFMMKYSVGQKVGWWNEKYFFKGEDLDFCYKLKINNFKLFFYPFCKINHYEGFSSKTSNRDNKIKIALASTKAMKIFYQENLINNYPPITKPIIILGINFLAFYRLFKARYL